tara:strand:+ start:1045 stop:1740 length:696 start_codon:yes stop_codon:yes gene_type:complete
MMETLVMIPGLASDRTVWERTIAALGDEVNCLVGDTLQDDSLTAMARRILDQAPQEFWLAGISMGGMIALEILNLAPARLKGLALVDTRIRPDAPDEISRRQAQNAALSAASPEERQYMSVEGMKFLIHSSATEDVREELLGMSKSITVDIYVRQNTAVIERRDLRPFVANAPLRTKVIVGEEDMMTPMDQSREIHDAIPHSELHIIPGCGHLPPIEKPEVMADLLRELIS